MNPEKLLDLIDAGEVTIEDAVAGVWQMFRLETACMAINATPESQRHFLENKAAYLRQVNSEVTEDIQRDLQQVEQSPTEFGAWFFAVLTAEWEVPNE